MSLLTNSISDDPLELGAQRKHRAKNFTDRREIVVRDPPAQPKQVIAENRSWINYSENISGDDFWLAIVEIDDDTHHALLPERNEDSSSDHRCCAVRDVVGKRHVQGHRKGDVAELGHWLEG